MASGFERVLQIDSGGYRLVWLPGGQAARKHRLRPSAASLGRRHWPAPDALLHAYCDPGGIAIGLPSFPSGPGASHGISRSLDFYLDLRVAAGRAVLSRAGAKPPGAAPGTRAVIGAGLGAFRPLSFQQRQPPWGV